MSKFIKVETYLPVFSGFYNTIFDYEPDYASEAKYLHEHGIFVNQYKMAILPEDWIEENLVDCLDFEKYCNDVVDDCIVSINNNCEFIKSIKKQKINSPKEYNFANDSVDVEIKINIVKLLEFIYANKDGLDQYFKERYTGCDGYIPFYPNSFDEWECETKRFTELDGHYLGSILDFYFRLKDYGEMELSDDVSYIINENYILYDKLLETALDNDIEVEYKYNDPNQIIFDFYNDFLF